MNVLLTGASGYIGLRLLPALLEAGHTVYTMVRDRRRFPVDEFSKSGEQLQIIEGDLLQPDGLPRLPVEIDAAYYLVHSMGGAGDFAVQEQEAARNFVGWMDASGCRRVIYLGGLGGGSDKLSKHLESRRGVEEVLKSGRAAVTVLRASIIVGSGSASFEIVRDLAEKLPVMICPRWVNTRCQPIAIRSVIGYLTGILAVPETENATFDIGGPQVLRYRDLLSGYAKVRGLKRHFVPVPFLSPRLSSWWLYLMTSTRFGLAQALVDSMKHETVCGEHRIRDLVEVDLCSYEEAVDLALSRIAQNRVPSTWFNSLVGGSLDPRFIDAIRVPEHGVYADRQKVPLTTGEDEVKRAVWSLGGENGWPSMNWAWELRGWMSRLTGGIGTRRGRRHPSELRAGDALDFWRVVLSDPVAGRLILYAEMKLPGEGWLDFRISEGELVQTATFRPQGLLGRLYWFAVLPAHWILFPQMAKRLAAGKLR
ncbi:SDR family oxidoreductase [Haloferula rosea]|uniref:SDR family oxidoreductase n=1 Tax=Haloferula rosea TaxID=490093 RepID=A0A934RDW2_9BACT|nr:SDR family oxidoreductase [Haloferula rosea]MBK1826776.1 SDR family oxidoreductase [Haloferula rosea]